jgi:HAD superfamily hydrolase (TIGR01662 family)
MIRSERRTSVGNCVGAVHGRAPASRECRELRGAVSAESISALVLVALVGTVGLTALGGGFARAIDDRAQSGDLGRATWPSTSAPGPTTAPLSAQAGAARVLAAAADEFSRGRLLEPFTPPASGPIKVAIFDADGTVRKAIGSRPPQTVDEVELLSNVGAMTRQLRDDGYFVAIASNQGGIAAGFTTAKSADEVLAHTVSLMREDGGHVHRFDFSEKKGAANFKPNTGMFEDLRAFLQKEYGRDIDMERSFMVGDASYARAVEGTATRAGKKADVRPDGTLGEDFSNSDRLFAENAGNAFHEARHFFGREQKYAEYVTGKYSAGRANRRLEGVTSRADSKWGDENITTGRALIHSGRLKGTGDLTQAELKRLARDMGRDLYQVDQGTPFEGAPSWIRDQPANAADKGAVQTTVRTLRSEDFLAKNPSGSFVRETGYRVARDGFDYSREYTEGYRQAERVVERSLERLAGDNAPVTAVRVTARQVPNEAGDLERMTHTLFVNRQTREYFSVYSRQGHI